MRERRGGDRGATEEKDRPSLAFTSMCVACRGRRVLVSWTIDSKGL